MYQCIGLVHPTSVMMGKCNNGALADWLALLCHAVLQSKYTRQHHDHLHFSSVDSNLIPFTESNVSLAPCIKLSASPFETSTSTPLSPASILCEKHPQHTRYQNDLSSPTLSPCMHDLTATVRSQNTSYGRMEVCFVRKAGTAGSCVCD
jgi:hypothetical protein